MKQYFALVAAGKVVSLNYEELPDPLPSGVTTKTLTQEQYDDLVADFNYNLVVNEANAIVTDDLAAAKYAKIKEAREYYESIDKFILDEDEYRIDKSSLRNLWIDVSIQLEDVALNGLSAPCGSEFNLKSYLGSSVTVSSTIAKELCMKVTCYRRKTIVELENHLEAIDSLSSVVSVNAYDETDNYPSIPTITTT